MGYIFFVGWITHSISSFGHSAQGVTMQEQNKGLMRRFNEDVFNKGNESVIDELTATDFVDHDPFNPSHDIEGVRQFTKSVRSAFPDVHFTVDDLLAEGDKVVARFTV